MHEFSSTLALKCVFCLSTEFDIPEGYKPEAGELIRCANCGKLNDFSSLMTVAEDEAYEMAEDFAAKETEKMLKKLFK